MPFLIVMPLRKYLFCGLIFFLTSVGLYAQSGVRLSHVKHVSAQGYIFKPTFAIEYTRTLNDIDSRIQKHVSGGGFFLIPRQDQLPVYGVRNSGGQRTVLPGFESYVYYISFMVGSGVDFKLFDKKFSPIIGADAYLQSIAFSKRTKIEELIDSEFGYNRIVFSGIPKVGLSYQVNENILIKLGVGKNIGFEIGEDYGAPHLYWKSFFTLYYYR